MRSSKKIGLVVVFAIVACLPVVAGGGQEGGGAGSGEAMYPEISILINESPWLNAFREVVATYEAQTGNSVVLVGTPYPGLLPKSINAATAQESEFDIIALDEVWANQFYDGGLVASLTDIDPNFSLDEDVIKYGWITHWDDSKGINAESGDVFGVPINGNMQILYYRQDLFDAAGIDPPETWDELLAAARVLHDPPNVYGFVARSAGRPDFSYQAVLHSYGGNIMEYDSASDSWLIGLDDPVALDALELWLKLVRDYSPDDYANIGQAQMISLMQSGRLAMQYNVTAAAPNFDDPNQSVVAGSVRATVVPGPTAETRAPTSGVQVLSIPHNAPAERQQAAAAFLRWVISRDAQVQFGEAGGIVTRQSAWEHLAENPDYWWAVAVANSTEYVHGQLRTVIGARIFEAMNGLLSLAVVNDITPEETLARTSEEIRKIMEDEGYTVR
jgi:multiple sugar transport system substrate-binding protein